MDWHGGTCAALEALEGEHGPADGAPDGTKPPAPARDRWAPGALPLAPRDDGHVRHGRLLDELGLDGLIDAHTHWFPERVMRKIWNYFDRHNWPIAYRQLPAGRLEWVRRNRVRRFTTLNYAHRPNMAAWLNEWTAEFCERTPEAVPCGTFYGEAQAPDDVRRCIEEYRFRGFKLHLRVSELDPLLPTLTPAFEQIEAAGLPVVLHCGSAPDPGRFTQPVRIAALLARHPRLVLVAAHMGAYEYEAYLALAKAHAGLYLDTTMIFTRYLGVGTFPPALLPRLEALSHKMLFGSDFPNIPYPLSHAVNGIGELPLSAAAKRRILHDNAAALFGLPRG